MLKDKNHSEQFERYLKGQMSPKEAHAFERAILDDPFAQEALEGFENHDSTQVFSDIKKLKADIKNRSDKAIPMMRIAAAIALLIVGSFTVYFFTNRVSEDQLAMEKEPLESISQSSPTPDTFSIPTDENMEEPQQDTFEKDGLKIEDTSKEVIQLAEEDLEIESNDNAPEETLLDEDSEIGLALADNEAGVENEMQQGRAAAIQTEGAETAKPSLEEVALDEVKATAEPLVAKKEKANQVQVSSQVSNDSAKGYRNRLSSQPAVARSAPIVYTPPRPINGNDLYNKYLEENLNYPEAAQENEVEGTVELELTINENGSITNIDIKKSLGYGCDQEAVRLINEGPKWNAGIKDGKTVQDMVSVKVMFKLN